MSATRHLMPSNAKPLLRELAEMGDDVFDLDPTPIETLWDAWRIPAALLPWLAWAMSVDQWDDAWDEVRKRQAIADSPYYHRIKGTRLAVEMALELARRPWDITEWFEYLPRGRRGTATIFIETTLDDIPRVLGDTRRAVFAAKPKSRAIFFGAGEQTIGVPVISAGLLEETLITIDPYAYAGEDADGAIVVSAGLLTEELITIEALT